MTDGHNYEYRAIAHNVAGSSEPGPASKPITAKPMKGNNLIIKLVKYVVFNAYLNINNELIIVKF